jgi:hypothetical protein
MAEGMLWVGSKLLPVLHSVGWGVSICPTRCFLDVCDKAARNGLSVGWTAWSIGLWGHAFSWWTRTFLKIYWVISSGWQWLPQPYSFLVRIPPLNPFWRRKLVPIRVFFRDNAHVLDQLNKLWLRLHWMYGLYHSLFGELQSFTTFSKILIHLSLPQILFSFEEVSPILSEPDSFSICKVQSVVSRKLPFGVNQHIPIHRFFCSAHID